MIAKTKKAFKIFFFYKIDLERKINTINPMKKNFFFQVNYMGIYTNNNTESH